MAPKSVSPGRMTEWILVAAVILIAAGFGNSWVMAQQQDDKPHAEVYGFVQGDYVQDFNRVDPAWNDTLRPSKIPTTDGFFGDDGQASLSAKQSRLGVMMNFPTSNQTVYTKFEFDMFGVGGDAGQTTIRLRHAYGQWGKWLGGQTNSLFMDASIFPNVIDYWGPAGMVYLRTPQIRYTFFSGDRSFAIAIERPGNDIDIASARELDPTLPGGIQPSQQVPDFTAQYRSNMKWGHWQAAGILRRVGFDTADAPNNDPKGHDTGWGVDGTAGIKFGKKDQLLVGVVYGHGIASYMNDGGTDLAPGGTAANGNPEAVPLLGVSAYYDHWWSERYSSSFGYSETSQDNTDFQNGAAFHKGQYASANLLHYPTKNVFMGGEFLWGKREDNGGDSGTDKRVQFSLHFSFNSKDIMGLKRNEE